MGSRFQSLTDTVNSDHIISHEAISRNHLEFYSIDSGDDTTPMIYVRDRQSKHDTHVNDAPIGRGNATHISPGRLLTDGDVVAIAPNLSFKVKTATSNTVQLCGIQKLEAEVRSSPSHILPTISFTPC